MKRRTKLFRLFCFVILGIVCGGVLAGGASGSDAGALEYKRYQRIDFTFEPTLKLILSSSDLVIPNLNVESSSDSNIISIETGTNVATGMQLTATVGRDDSAEHVGEEGYEDPYNTTSLVNGENSFAALSGPAASLGSSDFGVNKWGYAYSTDNGTTWVNGDSNNTSSGYNGLPIHSGTGVKIVDSSDKVDANLQFKIGAKASIAQAAGEYTNIINFYAVTKVATTNYTISYIDNSGQSQDMPTATGPIAITQDVEATISNSVPTRGGGYTFTGWCTASTNNNSCPGNYYQPGEKYPISNVGGNVAVNLYAMWKGPSIDDIKFLQDFDGLAAETKSAIINSMTPGQNYTRKDSRDQQDYTIAKLADGKVWMTKNLNLAGGTTLTSDKTDFVNGYTIPTNHGWQANGTLPASAVKNSDNNNLTDSSQFSTNNYAYVYNSGNTTGCGASGQNIPCYSYYSWDVATLGSGRSISTDNTDAPYSICPKGWKLPSTYNGSGTAAEATDFRALMIALGGSNSIQTYNSSTSPTGAAMYNAIKAGTAPNFLLAGYYNNGSFYGGGSSGYYWSSTSYSDSNYARNLRFSSSNVSSANSRDRRIGFSVRCLLRQ